MDAPPLIVVLNLGTNPPRFVTEALAEFINAMRIAGYDQPTPGQIFPAAGTFTDKAALRKYLPVAYPDLPTSKARSYANSMYKGIDSITRSLELWHSVCGLKRGQCRCSGVGYAGANDTWHYEEFRYSTSENGEWVITNASLLALSTSDLDGLNKITGTKWRGYIDYLRQNDHITP